MDIVKSYRVAYAYTIKPSIGDKDKHQDLCTQFFLKCRAHDLLIEYKVKEEDTHGVEHYHGIVLVPKGFYRKKLCIVGLHIKLEEIWNRLLWLKYIDKYLPSKNGELSKEIDDVDIDTLSEGDIDPEIDYITDLRLRVSKKDGNAYCEDCPSPPIEMPKRKLFSQ